MKKIILLAFVTLMMAGCGEKRTQPIDFSEARTYIVDSCEYVGKGIGSFGGVLAHKGNCRFCAERRKQELEALVEQIKEKRYESEDKENR